MVSGPRLRSTSSGSHTHQHRGWQPADWLPYPIHRLHDSNRLRSLGSRRDRGRQKGNVWTGSRNCWGRNIPHWRFATFSAKPAWSSAGLLVIPPPRQALLQDRMARRFRSQHNVGHSGCSRHLYSRDRRDWALHLTLDSDLDYLIEDADCLLLHDENERTASAAQTRSLGSVNAQAGFGLSFLGVAIFTIFLL